MDVIDFLGTFVGSATVTITSALSFFFFTGRVSTDTMTGAFGFTALAFFALASWDVITPPLTTTIPATSATENFLRREWVRY